MYSNFIIFKVPNDAAASIYTIWTVHINLQKCNNHRGWWGAENAQNVDNLFSFKKYNKRKMH